MKTKLTFIWLVLIIALTPIGNSVYARGLQSARVLHFAHARKLLLFQIGGRDRLGPSEQLAADQQLISPNGRFLLIMQGDGNLVLYQKGAGPLWATGTVGSGAVRAVMETNGALILYNSSNTPVWTDPDPTGSATFQLLDDGSIIKVLTSNGEIRKWSWTGPIALLPNEQLNIDESLVSVFSKFKLLMQSDGNLVLYYSDLGALWATGTVGSGAVRAVMQSDGNLVLYRADNTPVWASNTVGQAATLWLGTDGNLSIIRNADKVVVWSTNTAQSTLRPNSALDVDQKLTSPNGQFFLMMQSDGNLVLYQKGVGPLWATGTTGSGAFYAYNNGSLVVVKRYQVYVWQSPSFGGDATLKLQDDGNLVAVRDKDGVIVWSTNTGKVPTPPVITPTEPEPTTPPTPSQQADLVITGHGVSKGIVHEGEYFEYQVSFANSGTIASGTFVIRFWLDGAQYAQFEAPSFNAGEGWWAYARFPSGLSSVDGTFQDHRLAVCLDADNQVQESNESNNCTYYDLDIARW